MNIVQAIRDKALFGAVLQDVRTWKAWVVALAAAFALPVEKDFVELFKAHTGRSRWPTKAARFIWFVVGRRGGKSMMGAITAVFLACFVSYAGVLSPGETGVLMVIAADRRQARVVFGYIAAIFDAVPMLKNMEVRRTKESLELSNSIRIEVHTASFRTTRGYTVIGAVLDELSFWRCEDSANPAEEVIAALGPAMATVPNAMLIGISSPHARRGPLWTAYKKYYGEDDDRNLVWQAPTDKMNPLVPRSVIADAYEADEIVASAEYGAEFRRDIESFVSIEVAEACVIPNRTHLPPDPNVQYYAFCDPSGGSRDSFTLAIGHRSDETIVVDAVAERRAPFSPENVVEEFSELLRQYGISRVVSDRYAGSWPSSQFQKSGISCEATAAPKSDLYRDFLPLLNSRRIELPDNKRLINQLVALERRTSRSGRDSIAEPPSGFDDLINSVAGLAAAAELKKVPIHTREFLWG